MAATKNPGTKAVSQNPQDQFKGKQSGGAHGSAKSGTNSMSSGPRKEKIGGPAPGKNV